MLASTDFVTPYLIPNLNCEGLSSLDIARSLGARHRDVKVKIWLMVERIPDLSVSTAQLRNDSGKSGRPAEVLYIPTFWAKFVAAKFENERGDGYLQFLLRCEQVVMDELPRLRDELERVMAERDRLLFKTNRRALPRNPRALIFVYDYNMFGERYVIRKVWVDEKDATEVQVMEGQRWMCVRSAEGLMAKIRRLDDKLMQAPHGPRPAA